MQNHILIVDDDEEARKLLRNALRTENYQLSFAKNGAEGLELARQILPDTIITDLMMPVMNGLEFCTHLRADTLLATVPILMLTSMNDRASRLQGIEAGADDFLSKPCDRTELRTRLRTITRLNRYRRLMNEQLKFQWVVEQAREGYVLLNAQGHIEYNNACARELLSLPLELEEPLSFLDHVRKYYQCQPDNLWENWPPSIDSDASVYLVRPETRQSRALWLDARAFHSPDTGDVLVHLRDVSTQVSMQRRACTFESLISHKLLSPLGTMSVLPLLKKKLAPHIEADVMELLDLAIDGATRLQQQVQNIVTYVDTLDTVGLIQEKQHMPVKQVIALLKDEAEKQEITLDTQVSPDIALKALFSLTESDFQTLFSNLLNNAKKFHPQKQPTVLFQVTQTDEHVHLSLTDDGIHLPVEELDKVWQPYYQNEKIFTGEISGMGLGLSRVAAIVWSAGGQCHLNNREDKSGIQISLTLPIFHESTEMYDL